MAANVHGNNPIIYLKLRQSVRCVRCTYALWEEVPCLEK